jgi:hypothetical protein
LPRPPLRGRKIRRHRLSVRTLVHGPLRRGTASAARVDEDRHRALCGRTSREPPRTRTRERARHARVPLQRNGRRPRRRQNAGDRAPRPGRARALRLRPMHVSRKTRASPSSPPNRAT